MGKHYVPCRYLDRFAPPSDPGRVWQYDLLEKRKSLLPIKNVAQSKAFYPADYERWLNERIEGPAWGPLEQLVSGEPVDPQGRAYLSVFLASMLTRGPQTRRIMIDEMVPDIAPRLAEDHRDAVRGAEELSLEQKVNLVKFFDDWEKATVEQGPSDEVELGIRSPDIPKKVVGALMRITWRVIMVSSRSQDTFITGDTPVFFNRSYGLKPPYGELSFPISPWVALHASWHHEPGRLAFVGGNSKIVREFNRRTVFGAERMVFANSESDWIFKLHTIPKKGIHRVLFDPRLRLTPW